jgi:purine-binding chemotaxis protein CheW
MQEENVSSVSSTEVLQLVCFKLAEEEYAVDITSVQEVIRVSALTPVPQMPDFVLGVINVRGNIIPVFDLRKEFRLPEKEVDDQSKIIILNVQSVSFGIIADHILDNVKLDKNLVDPAPEVKLRMNRECIKGLGEIGRRMIIILNLEKVNEVINSAIDTHRD